MVRNAKAKGIGAERELIHQFWKNGWSACRVAGSGASRYPSPDIIAGKNVRKIVIECKTTKDKRQAFSAKQIEELKEFSDLFGAEPWVAVKFYNNDWHFLTLADLNSTGENYSLNIETARRRGFMFEEMIE